MKNKTNLIQYNLDMNKLLAVLKELTLKILINKMSTQLCRNFITKSLRLLSLETPATEVGPQPAPGKLALGVFPLNS